ncbi:Sec1/munc18-like (SM) proteins superfamily [Striga asiatica]|uniref:Sec1/munc18-like (SM) proteins superfamily n=1 Tax=Striga asiatica TaxID=4170 RepID=A0A5A7PYI9_STRAF|nr:Sec1/munc18-like (SM) proteins superfamily [Striga asiatica]
MEQAISALNRAANSNAVVNTALAAVFGVLAARSVAQEREIKALEAEKDDLVKANKAIKSTIWDWKQKLYAEAEANPQNALVPLLTLKSIYGEAAAGNFAVPPELVLFLVLL